MDEKTADLFVRLRVAVDVSEAYEAQREFLPGAYATLGVSPVPPDAIGLQLPSMAAFGGSAKAALRQLSKEQEWRARGPSVKAMAEAGGRLDEYHFFYRASSQAVHSSLHEMGRMAWGNMETMVLSLDSRHLAPTHFNFAVTYGTYVHSELLAELAKHLPVLRPVIESNAWCVWLALILHGVASQGLLPPIVTDEELRSART